MLVADFSGRTLYVNPGAERLYGRSREELIGVHGPDVFGMEVVPQTAASIVKALSAGGTWEGDFHVQRPDGSAVVVHALDSPLRDDAGKVVGIVSVVTDVSESRRSLARLSEETKALRFLLDATTVLVGAYEYDEALEQLAQLAVPALADVCLIDVLADGSLVRRAAVHADPARQPLVDRLRERPPAIGGAHPAAETVRTGRSQLAGELDFGLLEALAWDDEHIALGKQLGCESYLCAPLVARGRTLGSLTLISAGSGRRLRQADLGLAEDLARRAALVIDNARILSERSEIARSLQSALLPPTLPAIPGVEVAAAYRAAGEANDVGGDFYDVFELGRGAWAVAVGDVSGRGPGAAAVTGLVRHALRASGLRRRHPSVMLEMANALFFEEVPSGERFCTATCAVIRPGEVTRAWIASAGHPAPALLRADGTVELVGSRGIALGIVPGPVSRSALRIDLAPGDALVFYTDGLTEARDQAGRFFGEEALEEALGGCRRRSAGESAVALRREVEEFAGGTIEDDLALVVLKALP